MTNYPRLQRLTASILVVLGICANPAAIAQTEHHTDVGQTPTGVGGDHDAHGCKASAGYLWNEELTRCVRPWMSSAITLEVAPQRRLCTGLFEAQCLLVREVVPGQPEKKWEPLFSGIAGFKPELGVRYTVRVRKDRAEQIPVDAPDTTYTLIRVLP
jgi:hypothetical protein